MLSHHERIVDVMHRPGMYGICTLQQADEVEELFALVREFLAEARQLTLPPPPARRFLSQERAGAEER
ncbi:hypothetical protein [Amycolatopsis sp. NPDC003676]